MRTLIIEPRTKKFGCTLSEGEFRLLTRKAKKNKVSKTELIVRALKEYRGQAVDK